MTDNNIPNTERTHRNIGNQNRKYKNYICCQFWKQGQQPSCIAKYLQIDTLSYPIQKQMNKNDCCHLCSYLNCYKYFYPYHQQHYLGQDNMVKICWHCPCYQGMYCKGLDLRCRQSCFYQCKKCYESFQNQKCEDHCSDTCLYKKFECLKGFKLCRCIARSCPLCSQSYFTCWALEFLVIGTCIYCCFW